MEWNYVAKRPSLQRGGHVEVREGGLRVSGTIERLRLGDGVMRVEGDLMQSTDEGTTWERYPCEHYAFSAAAAPESHGDGRVYATLPRGCVVLIPAGMPAPSRGEVKRLLAAHASS